MDEKTEATEPGPETTPAEDAPLPKGQPLTLQASIERMYERYARTFEELAK